MGALVKKDVRDIIVIMSYMDFNKACEIGTNQVLNLLGIDKDNSQVDFL